MVFHSNQDSDASVDEIVYGQRLSTSIEIQRILEQIIDERVMLTLSSSDASQYATTLRAANIERGTISFAATKQDPNIESLIAGSEIIAELYLDSIKLQFSLESLVKVQGEITILNANYPREIIRLQRRSSYRVKPLKSAAPIATFRHPAIPDMTLQLRILDISLGGVALVLPKNIPTISAGIRVSSCQLQLDATSTLRVDIMIRHIWMLNQNTDEMCLGCEIVDLRPDAEHTLLNYINHTQKRQYSIRR